MLGVAWFTRSSRESTDTLLPAGKNINTPNARNMQLEGWTHLSGQLQGLLHFKTKAHERLLKAFDLKFERRGYQAGGWEHQSMKTGVKFPPSYIWWLKNYRGGDIYGDEIFSIYERDFDSIVGGDIVYMNELDRKNGLLTSNQLAIQANDQAETYFLSLNEVDDLGECPVYIDLNERRYADNFLHFLAKKIQE
ncbi:MAG: SMI1/KNR4 family protein [Bacteroidota bacterium]